MEAEGYCSSSEASSEDDSDISSTIELYPLQNEESDDSTSLNEDNRAWGKKKKVFYNADASSDERSSDADLEEEEVDTVQDRIYSNLSEGDFESHWLNTIKDDCEPKPGVRKTKSLKIRDDALPKLVQSFQRSLMWILEYGIPVIQSCTMEHTKLTNEGNAYLQSKIHLMLCYCVNIMCYLELSINGADMSIHPVTPQIVAFRQLISRLDKFEELEADVVLNPLVNSTSSSDAYQSTAGKRTISQNLAIDPLDYYEQVKTKKNKSGQFSKDIPGPIDECEVEGKRAITYQIARNKGIAPSRKKEQRNPRVKHRNKYRKALIKRRSQVLPVVHERNKYDGESTGIRTKLTRSVILK